MHILSEIPTVVLMNRTFQVALGFLVVATACGAVTALSLGYAPTLWNPVPVAELPPPPSGADVVPVPKPTTITLAIERGDTLSDLLDRAGASAETQAEMAAAIREVFDIRKLRAGEEIRVTCSPSRRLESLEYVVDPDHRLVLSRSEAGYTASVVDVPGTIRTAPVCGTLEGSLFESIDKAGESPELAIQIAEIFAWDLDFYSDPQEGDRFCVLVEKKVYLNGQPPTYKRILSATYNNAGKLYDAFLFEDRKGEPHYYSHDGRSLQAAFLRSPIKFDVRVSSHFSRRRFHPVLRRYRPHLGTDYAAPRGTPVQAVAAGKVVFSGRSGGSGNMVRIRHANGYETYYLHLSRRLARAGQTVKQGQRVGLVGSTGLATGPHLDFRIRKSGRFVNFERLDMPRASTVSAARKSAFHAERDRLLSLLGDSSSSGGEQVAARATPETPAAP